MLRELTAKLHRSVHLTQTESEEALKQILEGDYADEDIGAFLIALSEKGETADEITGFARGMKSLAVPVNCFHETFVDTAGTGGGVATFNVSTAAAFVISGAGVPVAKHGNRAITSRSGSADVLVELGLNLDASSSMVEQALNEIGLCFMFAPSFHPAMKRVAMIRRKLQRRTIFNMVGPLTNPAGAPCQIIGVYASELTEKLAESLRQLGSKRAWVVHSYDGLDEISVSAETRVAEVKEDEIAVFDFKPLELQIGLPSGGTPSENAKLIKGILENNVTGPARAIVILNAAAAIHIASDEHMTFAIERATESLDSGSALRKLEQLIRVYDA